MPTFLRKIKGLGGRAVRSGNGPTGGLPTSDGSDRNRQRRRRLEQSLAGVEPDRSPAGFGRQGQAGTVCTLGHELRTPLSSMKSSLGIVLRGEAGELTRQQERFLQMALRNIDRLDRLIGDLLESERPATERFRPRRRRCDLAALVRDTLEMLAVTARRNGVELDYGGWPVSFVADLDGDQVIQMVLNSVGNALKYTPAGGRVRVDLQADPVRFARFERRLADRLGLPLRLFALVVQDNGAGMEPELLGRLFSPYQRGREVRNGPIPGSGLGLHITRELLRAHGGRIELDSRPGEGTTVYLLMPRDPDSERRLVGASKLAGQLHRAGNQARLVNLDVRGRAGPPDPEQLRRCRRFLGDFWREHRIAAGGRPGNGEPEPGLPGPSAETANGPEELADGLWVGVVSTWLRMQRLWQATQSWPGLPASLRRTRWEMIPVRPGSDRGKPKVEEPGLSAGPVANPPKR